MKEGFFVKAIQTAKYISIVILFMIDTSGSMSDDMIPAAYSEVKGLSLIHIFIASACKNMWVSLGIGVILVFTLAILPQDNIVLSLFPFASPYQMLSAAVETSRTTLFLAVCGIETVSYTHLDVYKRQALWTMIT